MAEKNKIRVELVLSESDVDIIEMMEASGLPRATFFKKIVRDYKNIHTSINGQMERVVKQAVHEALSQREIFISPPEQPEVKPENKRTFGNLAKRL